MKNYEYENYNEADTSELIQSEEVSESFDSSFDYHAIPLDEQMTLDENGIPFTLQELMELEELREELNGNQDI